MIPAVVQPWALQPIKRVLRATVRVTTPPGGMITAEREVEAYLFRGAETIEAWLQISIDYPGDPCRWEDIALWDDYHDAHWLSACFRRLYFKDDRHGRRCDGCGILISDYDPCGDFVLFARPAEQMLVGLCHQCAPGDDHAMLIKAAAEIREAWSLIPIEVGTLR